jgi:hypothetical protein
MLCLSPSLIKVLQSLLIVLFALLGTGLLLAAPLFKERRAQIPPEPARDG